MHYEPIEPADGQHPNINLSRNSSLIEKALEYQLAGQIMARLLQRGHRYEVLHSVCDRDGYDIVIEANKVMRHIQLKSIVQGGRRRSISLPVALRRKPSGCAIITGWAMTAIQPASLRFFGGLPGQPLPCLGDKVTSHTRGSKAPRADHRDISISQFKLLADLDMLIDRLFGREPEQERRMLATHMAQMPNGAETPWAADVQAGDFSHIPADPGWDNAGDLAALIDGYQLIGQLGYPDGFLEAQQTAAAATGSWPGGATDLWITLFLEHRQQLGGKAADSGHRALCDRLVQQLRKALVP